MNEPEMSMQELKQIENFALRIGLNSTTQILQYGAGVQKKIADFSQKVLANVNERELGDVQEVLSGLLTELNAFNLGEDRYRGFLGIFGNGKSNLKKMKIRYERVELNVNKVVEMLERHQIQLMKNAAILDQMHELNQNYLKDLSMYILAGKKKLEYAKKEELILLKANAEQSGQQNDIQKARDYAAKVDQFEKRIYDLELTRMVSLQMVPQIRLLQNNDRVMAEKIQSLLVNTIPLWRNQILLALGVECSVTAAQLSSTMSEITDKLPKRNAENLKRRIRDAKKETERGTVDLEELKQTNTALIGMIDDVIEMQKKIREKHRQTEAEFAAIEQQVKTKL